jgi:D-beta-D-heptose 7-phosphate kinase/D-beta-D-heptose 1-phosphate adenosyltransferase
MVDEYYDVKVNRISPEFPMPIMTSTHDKPVSRPGGVANVAYQFRHFNVAPTLVCFPDPKAEKVFRYHNLSRWGDSEIKAKLPYKKRFLDGHVQVTRRDVETPGCGLSPDTVDYFTKSLGESIVKHKMTPDVAILSDYNKGFFSSTEHNVLDFYRHVKTIVDPKKGPLSKWKGCTIFKPNGIEAEALTGKKAWKEQAKHLQNELECEAVVITHSGEKVAGVWKEEFFCYRPEVMVEVDSVVGAGDCFGAFFAMAIGHGFTVPEAAEIAYRAGAVYVQHYMNRPVCPAELAEDGLVNPSDLVQRDFKLVFTNGCFDVLHEGHMATLKFAKSKGDRLVVALNSDESIKRLKGPKRPLVPLAQRMAVMAAIRYVDFVVSFDEDTPLEIIKAIKPDVLVKGGEYAKEKIIGADIVPEVYRSPMIEGMSTSKLLGS